MPSALGVPRPCSTVAPLVGEMLEGVEAAVRRARVGRLSGGGQQRILIAPR